MSTWQSCVRSATRHLTPNCSAISCRLLAMKMSFRLVWWVAGVPCQKPKSIEKTRKTKNRLQWKRFESKRSAWTTGSTSLYFMTRLYPMPEVSRVAGWWRCPLKPGRPAIILSDTEYYSNHCSLQSSALRSLLYILTSYHHLIIHDQFSSFSFITGSPCRCGWDPDGGIL